MADGAGNIIGVGAFGSGYNLWGDGGILSAIYSYATKIRHRPAQSADAGGLRTCCQSSRVY
jgi:hypothetical protein